MDDNSESNSRLKRFLPFLIKNETAFSVIAGVALAGGILFLGPGIMTTQATHFKNATENGTGGVAEILASAREHNSQLCSIDENGNKVCPESLDVKQCRIGETLSDEDIELGRIAWKYFENNYHSETGLVNAVNNYPSTTLWDTGSALAATIAAHDLNFIDRKDFDNRIVALLKSLAKMELFEKLAPNKVYNTKTLAMVDYGNKVVEGGIGISVLDVARLMSWMNTLSCMHPKYYSMVSSILSRWDYTIMIQEQKMWGAARDKKDPEKYKVLQEGRLGYEQYAAKIFRNFGFDADIAASYENEYRGNIEIMGVNIAYDTRDPRAFHANNYVVTESYTMDAMENGLDEENTDLVRNIFEVQRQRWEKTGIVTAISEDNINQAPWFLYNTIFNAGLPWQTTNSSDVAYDHLKTISTKAAFTLAFLYPEDEYSGVLLNAIESAYDPDKGWYSGIFENGGGYNSVVTANTNGVILQGLLFKRFGALFPHCESCSKVVKISSPVL